MTRARSENGPGGLPRRSRTASRIAARRSSGCAARYPPAGPIPAPNGALSPDHPRHLARHPVGVARKREDELRERPAEAPVLERQALPGRDADVRARDARAARGDERLGGIDRCYGTCRRRLRRRQPS